MEKQDFWNVDFDIYVNLIDFREQMKSVELFAKYVCHLEELISNIL